jgi:ribosomal protein L24
MSATEHGELRHGDTVVFVKGHRKGHKATFLRYTENDGVMLERGRDTIF